MRRTRLLLPLALSLTFSACETVAGVSDPAVSRVEVTPDTVALLAGSGAQLTAATIGSGGNVVSVRRIEWRSSSPAVADVSSSGAVQARAPGVAIITATAGGQSGSARVRVNLSGSMRLVAVNGQPLPVVIRTEPYGTTTRTTSVISGNLYFRSDTLRLEYSTTRSECQGITGGGVGGSYMYYTVDGERLLIQPLPGWRSDYENASLVGDELRITRKEVSGTPPFTLTYRR